MTRRQRQIKRPALYKPAAIVAPAAAPGGATRPIAHKKVKSMRFNWFLIGTLFGVGSSFFMNFLLGTVVIPQYEAITARHKGTLTFSEKKPAPIAVKKPTALEPEFDLSTWFDGITPDWFKNTHAASTPSQPATTRTLAKAEPPAPPKPVLPTYPLQLALNVSAGDTLIDVLIDNRVEAQDAHNVVAALRKQFNPSSLRVGQKINLTLQRHESVGDRAAVKELAIKLPNLSTVELERLSTGSFTVATEHEPTYRELRRAVGKVRSSLFQAAADAGIPSGAMGEIVKAFSYDIDFQREIHPGDTIEVLAERHVTKGGQVASSGKISYAALTLRGKKHAIYRFRDAVGNEGWYNARGESVKKSLLRTPVNAARMSSGFGMRKHPVLGYSRMHRGVDFAAPTGTPILAAGDGVVTFAGWNRGYGNLVKLQHNATYTTAYGHASRIASGIRNGARVKQGQVIAYVGSTGMSTGPHLHYEIIQNGVQVNPAQQRFNTAIALAGRDLTNFRTSMNNVTSTLARLAPNSSQALDAPKPAPAKPVVATQRLASR